MGWERYNAELDTAALQAGLALDDAYRSHGPNSAEYQRALQYEREVTRRINSYILGDTNRRPTFSDIRR